MIVSHKHQFVFFAVPRTATHAVRAVLEPVLGADDWQQQQLFAQQLSPHPTLAAIGHGHISVQQFNQFASLKKSNLEESNLEESNLEESNLGSYKRFAIVRNPFDRFVSACAFLNKKNPGFSANPTAWMLQAFERPQFRRRVLIRPQSDMLVDAGGKIDVDLLGRFETLQASVQEFAQIMQLKLLPLSVKNASKREALSTYYSDALIGRVVEFYASDFELLGYPNSL